MDLDTVVTVMAKDAEGNVLTSVSVSLGTYFAQLHEVDTYADTADALLIYALSVRDYYEATK